MKVFIFLLLFFDSVINKRIDYNQISTDDQSIGCDFQNYDQHQPTFFPPISQPNPRGCGGLKLSLRKIQTFVDAAQCNLNGAENLIDLLYSRIGQFELDWNNPEKVEEILNGVICQDHFKELYAEWETRISKHVNINSKKQSLCLFHQIFNPTENQKCSKIMKYKITKNDAAVFKSDYSIVIQPGAGFCVEHYNEIENQISNVKPKSEIPAETTSEKESKTEVSESLEETEEEECESPIIDDDIEDDPDFEPPLDHNEEQIQTLRKLGKQLGVKRLVCENTYNELTDREKRYKIYGGRTLLDFILSVLSPNNEKEVGSKICSEFSNMKKSTTADGEISNVLANQYIKATDKQLKKIILAPLAKTSTFAEISRKIPGLSYYFYNQAKKCDEITELPKNLPKVFHRYDEAKIRTFMDFYTSPHCMVILPFGSIKIKLSNGETLDIADNIQLQSHNQIINMYIKKMLEEGRQEEVLPRSTMFAILHHCHAKKSKEQTCVDYFLAAAIDGFDELRKILNIWAETEVITLQESTDLKMYLTNSQNYLKTDFSINLQQETSVVSHCFKYALSDPKAKDFTAQCTEHLTVCARCEALIKVLEDVRKLSDDLINECKKDNCNEMDELAVKQIQIDYAIFNILELKSHIVRARWSDMERAKDISELDETKAYITFDWAQKQLPMKFRETQRDYYGKNGFAHHITHVQTVSENAPSEQAFVHIIENNKQDSSAVLAIILDVLKTLKKDGIQSAILRSDNAGCYHSKELILSLEEVSRQSGVKITKYSFSEPQDGKGNCDRIAALVKNQVRRWVRESKMDDVHNVLDEKDFFEALTSYPGIPNTRIIISSVNRVDVSIPSTAMKGIASFYTFTFRDDGVLVHRAANIGDGKLFRYNNKSNKKITKIPTLAKSNEHNSVKAETTIVWKTHHKRQRKEVEENECATKYPCKEESCVEVFDNYEDKVIHELEGKHKLRAPEPDLMKDFVIKEYQQKVKQLNPNINVITQALITEKEKVIDESSVPEMGWAHKKTKTSPKITEKAREFVRDKFNEGAKQKAKKWTSKEISASMASAKENGKRKFKPNEILFPEQIQPMLSKFAADQKKTESAKAPPNKRRKIEKNIECEIQLSTIEEDENVEECITDIVTQENRYINTASRALRHQRNIEIDEMYDSVEENTKGTN